MEISDVINSYDERRVDLLEDSDSALLGQKNEGTATRTKITHLKKSGLEFIGMVHTVSYGFWGDKTALLLAMRVSFRLKPPHERIKYTEISASFELSGKAIKSKAEPIVHRLLYHDPNSDSGTYHLKPKLYSSKKSREMNIASWTINENRGSSTGIPDELYLAMVVECMDPFHAVVEVEAISDMGYVKLKNWPWSKDEPLLFDLQTERGPQPPMRSFDNLTTGDPAAIFQLGHETSTAPPPLSESRTQSGSVKHVVGRVLRIQGIPFDWNRAAFVESFAAAAGLTTDCIRLSSFADNPYRHEKTAVMAIENHMPNGYNLPTIEDLSIKLNSLCTTTDEPQIRTDIVLSVDSDFFGFTALGNPVEAGAEGIE